MATARTKRPLAPRTNISNDKDVAELANQFASGLRIAEAAKPRNGPASKTKVPRAAQKPTEDPKSTAMKNVNTVLQSLSSAIQSDWKATTARSGSSFTSAGLSKLATTARTSLGALRKLTPGALDVERAALSTVGKLVTLEMIENALDILIDIQPNLSSYYDNRGPLSSSKSSKLQLSFLLLPLPTDFPIEANLQTLISTYLLHAQSIAARLASSKNGMSQILIKKLDEPGCFASWISFYTDLPEKTVGSLIKRYYVLLTSALTAPPALPSELLSIRFHALRALLLTSEPLSNSFWEQCLKFASSYAKSAEPPESDLEKSRAMLPCFDSVLKAVEARHDAFSMMSGKGWIMFCEYWVSLAKRTGDLDSMNKAVTHIRNAASASCDSKQGSKKDRPSVDSRSESNSFFSSRASASFAQTCTLLESMCEKEESKDLTDSISSSLSCLQDLRVMYTANTVACLDGKLRRGIEKLRRTCLKMLQAEPRAAHHQVSVVVEGIIDFLEIAMQFDKIQADLPEYAISALDSLFGLATSVVNPQNLDMCDKAFSYLAQGSRIIDLFEKHAVSSETEFELSRANYTRCLSGAFFNIAATLYKAEKFGSAIRFLLQACPMAVKAMNLRNATFADKPTAKGKDKETEIDNDVDAWKVHEEQLHRRWELLAVCYTKTGDRKLAHDAFVRGVSCYPFAAASSPTIEGSMSDDYINAESHKQVCAMIDRLTYIGAAEIFLEKRVSLLQPLQEANVSDLIISAVLMRQIRSLDESRWKPPVQRVIELLLEDLLSVLSKKHPVRRSRALVMQLEHFYYDEGSSMLRVASNVADVQNLLKDTADLQDDRQFASLCPYYLSLAKIWEIFHAHRSGESLLKLKQKTAEFLEEIELLSQKTSDVPPSSQPISHNSKTKKAAIPVRKGRPPATARKAVAAKVMRKNPVTPKPRRSLNAQPLQLKMCSVAVTQVPQEYTTLIGLLVMLSELLNIMGLTLPRMQVMYAGRLIAEKAGDFSSDTYTYLCTSLAYNLLRIGKYAQSKALLSNIRDSCLPVTSRILLRLRQAEVLAFTDGYAESVAYYVEANKISQDLAADEKGLSTFARVRERVAALERAALAAGVFATIQDMKGDLATSLSSNLQRLRLLNKATELLAKLSSPKKPEGPSEDGDPFVMSDLKESLPIIDAGVNALPNGPERKAPQRESRTILGGQEWRVATLLLETMHVLCRLYFIRGSAREAEYFANQAEELSKALHSPVHIVQALLRKSEIYLYLGQVESSEETLDAAFRHLEDPGVLAHVDARWMKGNQLQRRTKFSEAAVEYKEAWEVIASGDTAFKGFDNISEDGRRSSQSPTQEAEQSQCSFLPLLQAAVLRERVWLKRDELDDEYSELLQQLMSLPQLPDILANVDYLLGRLAVHDIHDRLRSDMSLNSLAESIIALPMGMTREKSVLYSPSQDVQEALDQADDLLSEGLKKHATRNDVLQLRNMAVSGALVSIYQASLGKSSTHGPSLAAQLLDMAASITIRRELLEAISFKSISLDRQDDEKWPTEPSVEVPVKANSRSKPSVRGLFAQLSDDSDDESSLEDSIMHKYWEFICKKHKKSSYVTGVNSTSDINGLPNNWMVISITLTEDKNALLISRQLPNHEPIVFCIPLRGRRDDDEEHFTYDDAIAELRDIIRSSDEGTKRALDIQTNDKEGKAAWWMERKQLDERLKELVGNIEFCWLGAFKTILSQPMRMPPDALTSFRKRLEKVFESMLTSYEKKSQKGNLKLDNGLLELLATLPPSCRDEELEDIIYFLLDLYHFHGLPVALAEVDVDVVAVHLRTALEEHHARMRGRVVPEPDAHTFLVLDKSVQPFPWESTPTLRGRSVSRVPSIAFISDRLALARCQRGLPLELEEAQTTKVDRIDVDPSKGYFVLNPGGDLGRTEERFKGWVNDMKRVGWDGIIGTPPSEQQFLTALSRKDLVVYFGHGGAEQYVRSHKIRHLSRCAATMLWGCSSGELRDMGDFDRVGTPNNYMIAGCPTLVANLWDVTDRDIDKFALAVFDKMNIHPKEVEKWHKGKKRADEGKVSIAAAVAQSRDACKLKYLTGAAVVVYGIPFYL